MTNHNSKKERNGSDCKMDIYYFTLSIFLHLSFEKFSAGVNIHMLSIKEIEVILIYILSDSLFLLRFLRVGKFSQLRAREMIENYLTAMNTHPEWFKHIDPTSPRIRAFLKTGYVKRITETNILLCGMHRVVY